MRTATTSLGTAWLCAAASVIAIGCAHDPGSKTSAVEPVAVAGYSHDTAAQEDVRDVAEPSRSTSKRAALGRELVSLRDADDDVRHGIMQADASEDDATALSRVQRSASRNDVELALESQASVRTASLWTIIEHGATATPEVVGREGARAFHDLCLRSLSDEQLAKTCYALTVDAADRGEIRSLWAEELHERVCAVYGDGDPQGCEYVDLLP